MPLAADSLVLYKIHPARVVSVGEKIEIEVPGGQTKRVRPKDITPLHPGPLRRLADLGEPGTGNLEDAWELLEGAETNLKELAELIYDDFTPTSAWAVWQLLAEGLYFQGTAEAILPRPREAIEQDRAEREAKARAEQEWAGFMERLGQGRMIDEDRPRLAEVERLANQQSEHSRILKALDLPETPQAAHRLLTRVGYWTAEHNPYPARSNVAVGDPDLAVPPLPDEDRLDLTHLPAFAIDDEGNQDPDDAVSLDGERIWVHVADVAVLVAPDGELDREARARGANLYLPEGVVNMLPAAVTEQLGLGLQATSPALSFGFRCDEDGSLADIDIRPTLIRAERLTYAEAETRLVDAPFAALDAAAQRFRARREAQGAAGIDLPEVSIRIQDGEIVIRPIDRHGSRAMVTDLMLMAGEAAARWCGERGLVIPHATQPSPDSIKHPEGMAAMYAYRRQFKPSRTTIEPAPHFGLGLDAYARATSPLRRYADLLVHQQIRATLAGREPLTAEQVSTRAGEADQGGIAVRRTERQSNQHWKLVYLMRHKDWRGEGVVVELGERKDTLLIPELAFETKLRAKQELSLDQHLRLGIAEVDLYDLDARFRVLG
ncbi:MAG: RNB domain-containing ribonuclease [Thiohalocapsa sp.]|uniref:RNB domain-containing ribonuclease n=1 Tax=Thiohalocapsa sp. TaxID=2497641 RepID=UPI0025FF1CB8|nr:RNB domain-containing ribonuclease [Thiohalocapsa sp.]MCG6942122.1 RNB domain-containing ribonuclease [Thiohalocapsa sp.]